MREIQQQIEHTAIIILHFRPIRVHRFSRQFTKKIYIFYPFIENAHTYTISNVEWIPYYFFLIPIYGCRRNLCTDWNTRPTCSDTQDVEEKVKLFLIKIDTHTKQHDFRL